MKSKIGFKPKQFTLKLVGRELEYPKIKMPQNRWMRKSRIVVVVVVG